MRVKVLGTFLDGRDRYEAGDERTVDERVGALAVRNGWAVEIGELPVEMPSAPEPVTLEIHGAAHAAGDSNG
jgi:hypothetical protein